MGCKPHTWVVISKTTGRAVSKPVSLKIARDIRHTLEIVAGTGRSYTVARAQNQ